MNEHGACVLVSAGIGDVFKIWRLANDTTVRENSFGRERIGLREHVSWYLKEIRAPHSRMYIITVHGKFAGQIRYNRVDDDISNVNFSIVASMRGFGLGTCALSISKHRAVEELGTPVLRATVLTQNIASQKAFLRAGYQEIDPIIERGYPCRVFEWVYQSS